MAKRQLPVYTDPTIIYNPHKKQYWQCGMWVDRKADATIYPDENEASLVVALRRLNQTELQRV